MLRLSQHQFRKQFLISLHKILRHTGASYKRTTTRGEYGMKNLEAAVADVRAGKLSKNAAEKTYDVPRKTLSRHLKGLVAKPGQLG